MARRQRETGRIVREILGNLGKISVMDRRGGIRIDLHLKEEHGPQLILPQVTRLKERLSSFKLDTYWKGNVGGVGYVRIRLTYPHSENLRVEPKYRVDLPYCLSNSPSSHETHGKYFIVSREPLEHPHDNIGVQLTIRANNTSARYTTDLDLVGIKNGKIVLAEVLNGRTTDIKAALIRKGEVWSALKSVGIPIDKTLVYIVVPTPRVFKRNYLAEIINVLKERGFSGILWLTNKTHSKHEEFAF